LAGLAILAPAAQAALPPVEVTLRPGAASNQAASTTIGLPPKTDVAWVVDRTGDMTGPVNGLKAGAATFAAQLQSEAPSAGLGLVTFQDFPYSTFGDPGDKPFALGQGVTTNAATWQAAVNAITAGGGSDDAEAQAAAMYKALTGSGLSWPGGFLASDSPPAGTFGGARFRTDAAPVLLLLSHGPFHNGKRKLSASTYDTSFQSVYSFASPDVDSVVTQLNGLGVKFAGVDVAGLTTGGDSTSAWFSYVADKSGMPAASVQRVMTTDGSGITTAAVNALHALTWTMTAAARGCGPVTVTPNHTVTGAYGAAAAFTNAIAAPADATGQTIHCFVDYKEAGQTLASQDLTIHIVRDPTLAAIGDRNGTAGEPLSFTLSATDPDAGDTLTFAATGLPSGATLDPATGAFSWTPTAAGTYGPIHFSVSDGTGGSDSEDVSIEVAPNAAPVLGAIGDKSVREAVPLTFTLAATDADGDTPAYSATGLPTGATLNPTSGAFAWTPPPGSAGSYGPIHFVVSDGHGNTDTEDISIQVTPNAPPVLAGIGSKSVVEGATLSFVLSATDADGDPRAFSATGMPAGATLNSASGAFSWTAGPPGAYGPIHFSVSDGHGGSDSEDVPVTVSAPPAGQQASDPQVLPPAGNPITTPLTTTSPAVAQCVVPALKGMKLAAARTKLGKAQCRTGKVKRKKAGPKKRGKVLSQSPKAGRVLAVGGKVALLVGK
jgi:hypothetical protein